MNVEEIDKKTISDFKNMFIETCPRANVSNGKNQICLDVNYYISHYYTLYNNIFLF